MAKMYTQVDLSSYIIKYHVIMYQALFYSFSWLSDIIGVIVDVNSIEQRTQHGIVDMLSVRLKDRRYNVIYDAGIMCFKMYSLVYDFFN